MCLRLCLYHMLAHIHAQGGHSWAPECCDKDRMALEENTVVWDLLLTKMRVNPGR